MYISYVECEDLTVKYKFVLLIDVKSSADIRHDDMAGDKHRSSRVSILNIY